jgi:transcription elongation factor
MPVSINEPSTPAFEEVSGAVTPTISALTPDTCAIGDPDFDLHVTGENFTTASIIYFAGQDEPTTLNEDGTVSTGVNMDVWHGPDTVNVYVRNGTLHSNALEFTFTEAGAAGDELPSDAELSRMTSHMTGMSTSRTPVTRTT